MKIEELIKKAENLKKEEKYEDSIKILEDLLKEHPNSNEVLKKLIETLLEYGIYLNDYFIMEYEKAKACFEKILELEPNNYRAHYNLGIALFNLENFDGALKSYYKALELKPDYKYCLYNIGLVFEAKADLNKALEYYQKALNVDPNFMYAIQAVNDIRNKIKMLKTEGFIEKEQVSFDIDEIKDLFKISKKIKIDHLRELLRLNMKELLHLLINWGQKYQFQIDGDYLIINKNTVEKFLNDLNDGSLDFFR
ncbi:MAG: tetratricopeptide repeat protein [Promethearchaeota archaeon]